MIKQWLFIGIILMAVFSFSCQKETPTQVSTPTIGDASFAKKGITRGDVESVFDAFTTGGRIVLYNINGKAGFHAAPDDLFKGSIRPFSQWNGLHFLVDDWHVILIGIFDGGDSSYKRKDAVKVLSPINNTFTLNGVQLQTETTSIKRFLEPASFGLDVAYGFQEGIILAPGELAVGTYTLNFVLEDPELGVFENEITFFVDPPQ